jgi:hypothetical protein
MKNGFMQRDFKDFSGRKLREAKLNLHQNVYERL